MYHRHDHWTLFFFIDKLIDQSDAYQRIKDYSDEEKKTNKYLGLQAVKYNIACFIFMAIVAGLAIGTFIFFKNSGIWQGILMLIAAIVFLPFAVIYFIFALNCDIKQMKINKLPIGWVSLMFTLLILVGAIVAIAVTILVLSI